MKKRIWGPLAAFIVLLSLWSLACGGSSNEGTKLEGGGSSGGEVKDEAPKVETYSVGDLIEVSDHTIVLNSAEFDGKNLKANFTIENKGSDSLAVSSLMSFEAKDTEGVTLEQDIFDCNPGLDGEVLAGDKLKGNICWKGATADTVKIYYKANLLSSGAVVWEIEKQ